MVNAIRQARELRGWSSTRLNYELRRVAALPDVSIAIASQSSLRVMISQWENGHQVPSPGNQALLERAFGLPAGGLGIERPADATPPDERLSPLSRQRIARLEVSDSVLHYFEHQLSEHVRLDDAAGPGLILDVVATQVSQLRQIAENGPIEAVELAARFLEHSGWLYQDSGDLDRALRYTDEAVDLADRAGSPGLTAYNMMRKSNVLSECGEQQRAKTTAQRAARLAEREAPEQQAICLRQVALSAAHLRDERAVRIAVEKALSLTEQPSGVGQLAAYCTTSYVQMESAMCLLLLGQPQAAAQACQEALDRWPDGHARDEGLCLARLALAQLDLHHLDDACAAAIAAVDRWRTAPSARGLHILRIVGRRVAPHRRVASVRELRDALATVA